MTVLKVEHLTKDFGHGRGIFDVNFEINKGEVLGFLGPNGAGKSTTIRHLMGFTKPGQGKVEINGFDCTNKPQEVMKYVGYLPGEVALPDDMTGGQFIKMMKAMRHIKDDRYLNHLIELFDLDYQGSMKKMSLGEKRKLAVVVAFMADPEILILDEPTSGLDPVMQEKFIEFMVEEKRRGKTILLSSHIFPEVEATCNRINIIKEGRIVAEVDAADLKNERQKNFQLGFTNPSNLAQAMSVFDNKKIVQPLVLEVTVAKERISDFFKQLADLKVIAINERRFNLEKYFLDFHRSDKVFEEI